MYQSIVAILLLVFSSLSIASSNLVSDTLTRNWPLPLLLGLPVRSLGIVF